MDKLKQRINQLREEAEKAKAESEALQQMIIQCKCGIAAPAPDLQNKIQYQKQIAEQLQTKIINLTTKLRTFRRDLLVLFNGLETMQRNLNH